VLLLLLSFYGHGGSDWVWKVATPCGIGGVWGNPLDHELFQARGNRASAISCRHGGKVSTSDEEAISHSAAEARRHLATKWSRPRWLGDGRWQKDHAGREPTSCSLSILGGDA
jgi:hypothetical protein